MGGGKRTLQKIIKFGATPYDVTKETDTRTRVYLFIIYIIEGEIFIVVLSCTGTRR